MTPYEMVSGDAYCYPGTSVLINKLGITDGDQLAEAERRVVFLRAVTLEARPLDVDATFERLRGIHRYLFQDLYAWAGEIRTVDLSKEGSLFCLSQYILPSAEDIFGRLESERFLKQLEKGDFVDRLAEYMGDINSLHPFREGNGRAQRIFFSELARNAGYQITFIGVNTEELIRCDVAAMRGNSLPLRALLEKIVTHAAA